jgi:hypothetical protein
MHTLSMEQLIGKAEIHPPLFEYREAYRDSMYDEEVVKLETTGGFVQLEVGDSNYVATFSINKNSLAIIAEGIADELPSFEEGVSVYLRTDADFHREFDANTREAFTENLDRNFKVYGDFEQITIESQDDDIISVDGSLRASLPGTCEIKLVCARGKTNMLTKLLATFATDPVAKRSAQILKELALAELRIGQDEEYVKNMQTIVHQLSSLLAQTTRVSVANALESLNKPDESA